MAETIYNKILFVRQEGVNSNVFLVQTYVQPTQIMYRVFLLMSEIEQMQRAPVDGSGGVIEENELWTNDDLYNKTYTYNEKEYCCVYSKITVCSEHVLQGYREVYCCYLIPRPTLLSRQDQMFFADRLGETYFSKYKNTHWSKHIKATGCQYMYRFLIEPGKDLTTAAVMCLQDFPMLTNLEFDHTEPYSERHTDVMWPWVDQHKPYVAISGPDTITPNGTATFQLNVTNHDGSQNTDSHTYHIECKQGYAPNQEVKVVNGRGSFKIMALGLENGEKLRFKINDQVWTDYAEKELDVQSQ